MPPLFCLFFVSFSTAWYSQGTAYWRSCGVDAKGYMEGSAVRSVSAVPPNSIKKLLLCVTGSSRAAPSQSWVSVASRVGGMPDGACGRSHPHTPPATCTRGADVPSQWGLQYKQDLCPVSMALIECHQLSPDRLLRLLGVMVRFPILVAFPRRP